LVSYLVVHTGSLDSGRTAGSVPAVQTSGIVNGAGKVIPLHIDFGAFEDADGTTSIMRARFGAGRGGGTSGNATLYSDDQGKDGEREGE
jgi:hypothetical protein